MMNMNEMAPSHSSANILAFNNTKHRAIMPRSANWQLCQKIDYAIWCCPVISLDVRWSKNRFAAEPLVVHVQNVRMANLQKAFQFLKYVCDNSRIVTKLSVNVQVSDTRILNALLRLVLEAKNIRLEEIQFRRRYVGQQFSALVDLVRAHSETLRVVGKLGLGEAIQAFNEQLHLERCSLMHFDLIENGQMESAELLDATRACIRRLGGLGATFAHLSLTAFSGIEVSRQPMLHFLRACRVTSLRLTMQKGVAVPAPAYPRPLLYGLRRLELVGQMEIDAEARLETLFPELEHFDFQFVDLATGSTSSSPSSSETDVTLLGGIGRDRTVSEAISEVDAMGMTEQDYDNDMQEAGECVSAELAAVSSMAAAC